MYRERQEFKVRLKYDEIDRKTRRAYLRGDVVEVDLVGDPPGLMAIQDLYIADTDIVLGWRDFEIID